jgi:hypothetical protein
MHHLRYAFILPLWLVACAQYAAEIPPAAISESRYDDWSCPKPKKEQAFVDAALVRVSADQDQAAGRDTLMVALIGVPTSGGGVKGQVADLKGQQIALHEALRDHNCL